MTVFADASAIVAITAREPDWAELTRRLEVYETRLCSALAASETMAALCRNYGLATVQARQRVHLFLATMAVRFVAVGDREYELAADAYGRFGKGRHPAGLNMGDCFAYACARANDARLLFKGSDFMQTDILAA